MNLVNPLKKYRNRFYIFFFIDSIIETIGQCGGIVFTSFFLFLGLNDSEIATLLSLTGLITLLQIFSTLIYQKINNRKQLILSFFFLRTLFLAVIGFIPFFIEPNNFFIALLILLIIRFSFQHLLGGGLLEWNDSHVPEEMKGKYYGRRNAITNISFIISTFIMGKVLDLFEPSKALYAIFFGLLAILYLIEFIAMIKVPVIKKTPKKQLSLKEVFLMPINNPSYRAYIGLTILWSFAASFGRPLMNVYVVKYLHYNYTLIAVTSSVTAFIKIFAGVFFGHLLDKKGINHVIKLCGLGYTVFSFSFIFIMPNNVIYYVIAVLGLGIFMIGFNVSNFRLNVKLAAGENMNTYLSGNSFFGGLAIFASIYISGHIIDLLKDVQLTFFDIHINSYQILFFTSGILHLLTLYYFVKVLQERIENNGEV